MCLKVIVLRISGYINHTLAFLLGPSKCLYVFLIFSLLVFFCVDASPLGLCICAGPLTVRAFAVICNYNSEFLMLLAQKHSMCNGEIWSVKPVEFFTYFSLTGHSV